MKHFLQTLFLAFFSVLMLEAAPVRPGTQRTFTMPDGTIVTATLVGDEYGHWWQTADGRRFCLEGEALQPLTEPMADLIKDNARARRDKANTSRPRLAPAKVGIVDPIIGQKRGLVILVAFADKAFGAGHDRETFVKRFNQVGFDEEWHNGSVHDYFYDQSYGQFDLEFDIIGPVTVSENYSYYGKNNTQGSDSHPGQLVCEACRLIDDEVDFSQYDWDEDGYVDQVFVIYAGYGEAQGASSNTIWPHEWQLSSAKYYNDGEGAIELDGVVVDTYAVSCELQGRSGNYLDPIGTACHEFSHCLGFPDFYDTDYSGGYGMSYWDLLGSGCYNMGGAVPSGFTSYERWQAGWLEPIELPGTEDVTYELLPLHNNPCAYIIYNEGHPNEFYLLENRTAEGWFQYFGNSISSAKGMLVLHVDYAASSWLNNTTNNDPNHQRMGIIPANNSFSERSYAGNVFPYNNVNSLTNETTPAASVFNRNIDRSLFMNKPIYNITRLPDGTITFNCPPPAEIPGPDIPEGYVFYETFDKCSGTGGNDGTWWGNIASSEFTPDYIVGWEGNKMYGGDKCARFGASAAAGTVTTPAFNIEGPATLTFRAAKWNQATDKNSLAISINGEPVSEEPLAMAAGEWGDYTVYFEGQGETRITFTPSKRFFLDEVYVAPGGEPDGISSHKTASSPTLFYNLSGQRLTQPQRGINIVNGKKILVK